MLTRRPLVPTPPVAPTAIQHPPLSQVAAGAATNADPDLEDITLLARGDTAALARLYDRYARTAFAVAYQLLQDAAAAEDAVQDAYMRAWRNAASFERQRGSVRTWLVAIARHAAIDQLRSRTVAQRYQSRLSRLEHATTHDDPAVASMLFSDVQRLRLALDTLPQDQRQAVELAFFTGLTHMEIATRTGAPLGTVKGRLRSGLRQLRATLGDSASSPLQPISQPTVF